MKRLGGLPLSDDWTLTKAAKKQKRRFAGFATARAKRKPREGECPGGGGCFRRILKAIEEKNGVSLHRKRKNLPWFVRGQKKKVRRMWVQDKRFPVLGFVLTSSGKEAGQLQGEGART